MDHIVLFLHHQARANRLGTTEVNPAQKSDGGEVLCTSVLCQTRFWANNYRSEPSRANRIKLEGPTVYWISDYQRA
jgi:hypothetical protein